MRFARPSKLLAREIPDAYADCLRSDGARVIDVVLARRQHAGYLAALRSLGLEVEVLPAAEGCPDACFIEDPAVITGRHAVLARSGPPSRRPEAPAVGAALSAILTVHVMDDPAATLDGGDVLRAGARLFAGLSSRTNAAGIGFLARIAALDGLETIAVPAQDGLHLKSGVTLASETMALYAPGLASPEAIESLRAAGLECVATGEPAGANVLAFPGAAIVSSAAPQTAALLRARGIDVRVVEVGEIHAGDGALTCLSLRLPPPGGWCA